MVSGDSSAFVIVTPSDFRKSWKGSGIWSYQLSGTVYPCDRLGIDFGYTKTDFNRFSSDVASYTATAEWFIAEAISLSGSYTYTRSEVLETDSYVLQLTGRF